MGPNASRRGKINRAIFESQALALANYKLDELLPHRDKILERFRQLFKNDEYDNAVRSSTGDHRKVEVRLTMPRQVLDEIVPMIHKLKIEGFKRFKSHSFALRSITLLAGMNGTGKTSFIHALLLIREATRRGDGVVELNGPYRLEFGRI